MSDSTSRFDTYFLENRQRHLDELMEFMRIPSISTLPQHAQDIRLAADWAVKKFRAVGFPVVEILETLGHPCVYSEWIVDESLPTVLIYGHYDVQPVDPEAMWETPPFEPAIRDGRLYGRGASDDKGCLLTAVNAVEAFIALEGGPPINVKFLLEGEEEILSPNLPELLAREKSRLKCDAVVGADGKRFEPGHPALTVSVRGYCALQVDVTGPNRDLHVGQVGGPIPNPIHALAQMLQSLRKSNGSVAVEGFYEDVRPLAQAERDALAEFPFDEAKYLRDIGASAAVGEPGFTILELQSVRPTLEIIGFYGGYQGEGMKSVLPARAHAKLECHVVPSQDPSKVLDLIERHLRKNAPAEVKVEVTAFSGMSSPYRVPPDHPVLKMATDALRDVYGEEPIHRRSGSTVPLAAMVESILEASYIFVGFGDPDDRAHAPNEFFRLENFDNGVRVFHRILASYPR